MADKNPELQAVFEDLMSRFIINVPEQELRNTDRICFQIEQAHWYYEDFFHDSNPTVLPHFTLKKFAAEMFTRCPLLKEYLSDSSIEAIYQQFVTYKMNIPVCGSIILNQDLDKVLLVKGYNSKSSWSFPKGKINQNESEMHCAIRETLEEIGFDIANLVKEDRYVECLMRGEQKSRYYIVVGVNENTTFQTRTRKEISEIKWHVLKDLPGFSKKGRSSSAGPDKFYMINRVTRELWIWMKKHKKELLKEKLDHYSVNLLSMLKSSGDNNLPSSVLGTSPSPSIPGNESIFNDSSSEEDDRSHTLKSLLGLDNDVSKKVPRSSLNEKSKTEKSFGSSESLDLLKSTTEGVPSLIANAGLQQIRPKTEIVLNSVSLLGPTSTPEQKRRNSNATKEVAKVISPLLLLSPSKKSLTSTSLENAPRQRSSASLSHKDATALLSILKDAKASSSLPQAVSPVALPQQSPSTPKNANYQKHSSIGVLNILNSNATKTIPSSPPPQPQPQLSTATATATITSSHATASPITIPSSMASKQKNNNKDLLRILKGEV